MKKILIAFAAVALLQPGPASAQSRADRLMMADIRMLQEQSQQLAVTLAALSASINDALKAINTRIDQQTEATRKALADQKLIVDNIGADLRVIRERTDETNVRISTLGQELEAMRSAITAMQAGSAAPATPDTSATGGAAPAPVPGASSTAGLSPTRMYDQALADYGGGQWSLAISGFEAFLRAFPKSDRADDAQLFIGETYYSMGRMADAITAYNQVIQNYPTGDATPQAYYKRGLAQERAGELEAARASWEFLVKNHPESEAGRLAQQNLVRTSRKPGAP